MKTGRMTFLLNAFVISIFAIGIESTTNADLVVADFNDLSIGTIVGQSGGSGWGGAWETSDLISVRGGDLAAPASTNYNIGQSGSARSVATVWRGASRQSTRAISTPMTNTVWFSFLYNQPRSYSGGGISFNQSGIQSDFPGRVFMNNRSLRIDLNGTAVLNDAIELGEDTLIVGRFVINPGAGDEVMDVWVNPNLLDTDTFVSGDLSLAENVTAFDGGISRVGVMPYSAPPNPNFPADSGIIDSLRLSDRTSAFEDVTGVPEPSSMVVILLGLSGLVARRRRHSS